MKDALLRSGLRPTRLELEITESVLLSDTDGSLAALRELRAFGIRIAMDDFGTGYSSLSYLRRFPFDKIKIDQSFVREMSTRPDCIKIVRSIAALGSSLGMTTTAEGVETPEQFAQLQAAGCDQVQGYHFGRPEPAGSLTFDLAAVDPGGAGGGLRITTFKRPGVTPPRWRRGRGCEGSPRGRRHGRSPAGRFCAAR